MIRLVRSGSDNWWSVGSWWYVVVSCCIGLVHQSSRASVDQVSVDDSTEDLNQLSISDVEGVEGEDTSCVSVQEEEAFVKVSMARHVDRPPPSVSEGSDGVLNLSVVDRHVFPRHKGPLRS